MALPAIGGHIHLNHTAPSHQAEASPLLTRGNKLFEQSVQRGIGHFQSSDLKQVINALLQQSMAKLEQLGSYACTDAQTFVQPRNPKYQEIMSKLDAFGKDDKRKDANQRANDSVNMAAAMQVRNGKPISQRTMQSIAKTVDQAQAGCCSTLAYSATAELLRHNSDQRIEVLAHRGTQGHAETHCFVVIGRAEGSELSKPESWGPHAKVVDPWAATIGAPLVGTPARPPIANLWPPTESVFDNTHRED